MVFDEKVHGRKLLNITDHIDNAHKQHFYNIEIVYTR